MMAALRYPVQPLSSVIESFEAGVSVNAEDRPAGRGEHGVLKVSAIGAGQFLPEENKAILASELPRMGPSVHAGDVLVSRANTLELVGLAARAPSTLPNLHLSDKTWRLQLRSDDEGTARWLVHVINSPHARSALRRRATGTSGSMKNIGQQEFVSISVPVPPLAARLRSAAVLDSFARRSTALSKLVSRKRASKRELIRQLMESGGDPQRRVHLAEHTTEAVIRNSQHLGRERVMGVIKGAGLRPMSDRIRVGNLRRYKVVPPDAFAYNPMRINIGSIARNRSESPCLVSPDYVVFHCNSDTLLPAYLDHLRETRTWAKFMESAGAGSVRVRIYYRDLGRMRIALPPIEEQRRVVSVLDAMDREIDALQRLATSYEKQRRAVVDKLLSGELAIPDP